VSTPVRPAVAEDAAACAEVLRASIRELCHADHGGDPGRIAAWCANKTPENLARWIAGGGIFVAEEDGRLLAVGGVAGEEVTLNYVAPAARFRGVGSVMLARLEAELAAAGVGEGRLESTATAHRFYRRHGWADAGPPVAWLGMTGQPMRKRLG
jgi:GNAT superfamily N-acetyltransferase